MANQGSEFDLMQVLPKTEAIIQQFVQILVDVSEKKYLCRTQHSRYVAKAGYGF